MIDRECSRCKLAATCAAKICDLDLSQKRSEVMVIGETPNTRGNRGRFGELLKNEGIKPWFASAVNCEPPKGKKPTDAQIESCRYFVQRQIRRVKPKFVLLSGNAALYSIKDEKGISRYRGRPFEQDGIIYLPTLSQVYLHYDPEAERTIAHDIKLFSDIIEAGEIPREKKLKYIYVDTKKKLMRMLKRWLPETEVSFDIETTGLFPWEHLSRVTSIQFANRDRQWVVPMQHRDSPWFDVAAVVRIIDRAIIRKRLKLVTHNGKFDYLWMKVHYGVNWHHFAYFDTMIAHFLLDENSRHGLKELAQKFLGAPDWDIDKKDKIDGPMGILAYYAAHDVFYTRALMKLFRRMLRREPTVRRVFEQIMMPCVRMFVDIEFNGVFINRPQMKEAEKTLNLKIDEANAKLRKATAKVKDFDHDTFNWGSPVQVADLLYNKLKLKIIERTEAGNPSVSESVLLRTEHPLVSALLEYRGAKQQLSFFIEGWKPYLVDGWLHPSFKLHGTVTGRLSCENPNLQQVPRDGFIRTLITAPEGWELIEADLSQIELRIAAELAGAESLITVFKTGGDAHWLTALTEIGRGRGKKKLVLTTGAVLAGKEVSYDKALKLMLKAGPDRCIDIEPAWKELRKKAKAVNFGYLFGMWWKKFKIYARDNYGVDVTDEQAQESRENFFNLYPEFEPWHRRQKRTARTQGFVSSLSGRRRRLPHATHKDDTPQRREAERQAINSPVQSFANEINLMTAVQISREYGTDVLKLCGTVHDSILCLVRKDKVVEIHNRILEIMRKPDLFKKFNIKLKVPIEGEAKIGAWGKGVTLERWLNQSTSKAATSSTPATKKKTLPTSRRSVTAISSSRSGSSTTRSGKRSLQLAA